MIVTIDGPAGAGKSTVARALARRLGFQYLDTGAMYRAVALAALRAGLSPEQPDAWAALARRLDIRMDGQRIMLDGEDVTRAVRTLAVTAATRYAADHPEIRKHLVALQQAAGASQNIVTEGRDQGTLVFPGAECKIFLTASPEERARRRLRDLVQQGEPARLEDVLADQERRDREDQSRPLGALRPAPDAIEVSTDGLTEAEVVDRLESLVRAKVGKA